MRDRVRYAVPFDFIAHPLLVRRDVERIFAYRTECLQRRFGATAPGSAAASVEAQN
jgi:hypothetical protein